MIPNIRMMTARLAALLVLAALLCAGVQAAVAAEQTLTMSIGKMGDLGTDPTVSDTLMPGIGGSQPYHYWTHFSPLITLDSDGSIIPWMAESYEVTDDYRTITFHLRKGVKFADGTPLNASVLKFNFDRIIKYGLDDYAGKNSTRRWDLFMKYDYSEAIDENTFAIHFSPGWMDMPHELAFKGTYGIFISPTDVDPVWDLKGTLKEDKKYNGLGAYYVDENESFSKQKVVLKRRHSWFDDYDFHKPKLDKLVLTYIADTQVAVMALEKGDIDFMGRYWNVPLDRLPEMEDNPKITIMTRHSTYLYYIATAWWKEPFNGTDGILLRKAINYALDRKEVVNGALNGYATPATDAMALTPLRQDIPECCDKGYDYDLEKAKQLLAEAGWRDTNGDGVLDKDGKPLDLDLVIQDTSDLWWMKDIALMVQSQLKEVGINIKIRSVGDSAARTEIRKKGDYDLVMNYNGGSVYSIPENLRTFNLKGVAKNSYGNQNGILETIAEDVVNTLSEDARNSSVCQVCDILYEEAGIIPLVYPVEYAVMSSKVKGFNIGPYSGTYFMDHIEECWIGD